MSKLGRGIKRLSNELKWKKIDKSWNAVDLTPRQADQTNTSYSIGITTYIERLDSYLIPLVKRLHHLFPDTQIIVAINGYHDAEKQQAYLTKIRAFLGDFPNVISFDYVEPQGLCTLWNQMVLRCKSPRLLICNEDLNIAQDFRNHLEASNVLTQDFALINGSYSHFLISKKRMAKVGWFDERFPGIGYEDHDYEIRMALKGFTVESIDVDGLKNENVVPKDWSWGDSHSVIFGKYSGPNEEHYFKKWSISKEEEQNSTWVRIIQGYAQLKEGMATPDFYPGKLEE